MSNSSKKQTNSHYLSTLDLFQIQDSGDHIWEAGATGTMNLTEYSLADFVSKLLDCKFDLLQICLGNQATTAAY